MSPSVSRELRPEVGPANEAEAQPAPAAVGKHALPVRVSDALVEALRDWGVRFVFGVSGANIEKLHDGIFRLREPNAPRTLDAQGNPRAISSVLCRREDSAAFMADSHARVHRTLGVCCSTSGGAMFNLAAGIGESFAESVPVLGIVGQSPLELDGKGAFQDSSGLGRAVDAVKLFECITKLTIRLTDASQFWSSLKLLVSTALSGRPGPVVLLLPRDVQNLDVPERPADWPTDLRSLMTPEPVDLDGVDEIMELIAAASAPTILVGQGVRRSLDAEAVAEFARTTRIPVATTMSARADFPNDDPLYLGMAGVAGHPSTNEFLVDRTDLLIVAGSGLNMMTRSPLLGRLNGDRIVAINTDPSEILRGVGARKVVTGDVGLVFRAMLARARASGFRAPPRGSYELTRYRPRLAAPIPSHGKHPRDHNDDLLQSEAIAELERYIPKGGHIVLDAGNCASAAMHLSSVPEGTSSTIALGAGGMGYGLAAAVGVQLGSSGPARTIAFCGDGGLFANGLEIHVAVDQKLPILFVIFNNQMHGMCAVRQQLFFEARLEASSYGPIDVASMARSLGGVGDVWAGSAGSLEELKTLLADYHQHHAHGPGVLELRLRHEQMPPFSPFLEKDEPVDIVCTKELV